jgi:N-acetylmuramoyl-L-alanine amidase
VRTLRRGDRGRGVVDLQTRLQALGLDLGERGIDGVFRRGTELAVKSFQQSLGLLADGLVGPITWREIVEAGYRPGGRLLYLRQPPFRGADVVGLQKMLNDLGFDPGAVNGLFDVRTARAVRDFQKNAGLQDDGVVDAGEFKFLDTYAAQSLGTHQLPDKSGGYFPEDLFSGAIIVDAAHGGRDVGYIAPRGLSEADLNLAVAQELAQILPAREVLLTRSDDEEVSAVDRAFLANSSEAKMVVSIHHAAHRSPAACGSASFYFERLGYRSHRGRMAASAAPWEPAISGSSAGPTRYCARRTSRRSCSSRCTSPTLKTSSSPPTPTILPPWRRPSRAPSSCTRAGIRRL